MNHSVRNLPNLEAMDLDQDFIDGKYISNISDISADNSNLSRDLSTCLRQMSFGDEFKKSPVFEYDPGKLNSTARSISHKSSTSSKIRHSSEQYSCEVTVFDMRKDNISYGEIITLNVQEQLVLQRIAKSYNVPESCLVSMQSGVSRERNPCVIAITENSENLTLFIRWDSGSDIGCKCVTVNGNANAKYLAVYLDTVLHHMGTYEKYTPFCNHHKLDCDRCLNEQGVVSGNELLFREIKPVTLKCLYRSSPMTDLIYYISSFTTDTIEEVKLKVANAMKSEPSNRQIQVSPEHIWLTSGHRLYFNEEYIGSPARTDINNISSGLSDFVDVVIHVQSLNCLPVNVLYHERCMDKIVISTSMSTAELRYQISTLIHCSPNELKITINQKRIPEIDQICNFLELKSNCTITATIRKAITINVTVEGKPCPLSVMKLDPIFSIKQKVSVLTRYQIKHIKLIIEDKEPNDHHQIEKAHLKDGSEVQAVHLPNRIRVCIRKHGQRPVHLIIDDSQKVKMKLLKCFYMNTIKMKPKYDINYHSCRHLVGFEDSKSLASQGIEDECTLYATEVVNCHKVDGLITIFDYQIDDQIHITKGAYIKGKLLKVLDDSDVFDESSEEFDSQEITNKIPGIRLAHPEEIIATSNSNVDNCSEIKFPDLSKALVPLTLKIPKPGTPSGQQADRCQRSFSYTESPTWPLFQTNPLENHYFMPHSRTLPNLGEPPGVVSDKDLNKLVTKMSANVWQSFMRELLPDAEITKHIESNKGNVSEQIFQCLKKWKQKEGSKATKKVLQDALVSQELNLISLEVFGMEVQSD